LAEGFDVVQTGGGTKKAPAARFECSRHGESTRNWRKLENHVECDEEGTITTVRQRENTLVNQTGCKWSARVSWKDIGIRGSGDKGFVLTVIYLDHYGHTLIDNPLSIPAHLRSLDEYQAAKDTARKHRMAVIPYSESRRVLEVEEFGLAISAKDYYNTVRKMVPDKDKPKTIDGLLVALQEAGFVYRCRVEIEEDEEGSPISRKLKQIWFAHKEQLNAAQRFVSDWSLVIDGTFNTNKDRLPLLIAVGVLNSGHTFPIAFSYVPSESDESLGFFWDSLKEECFMPDGNLPAPPLPRIVIADQAGGVLSSVPKAWPQCRVQICDWHAVEAMKAKYRKSGYKKAEIDGLRNKDGTIEKEGLADLSWNYIKSMTIDELTANRAILIAALQPEDQDYIRKTWQTKEDRVVYCYTKFYPNLGSTSSQRGESYHPVMREITNGQLSIEESAKRLIRKTLSILKDMATDEDLSIRKYTRTAQLINEGVAFQLLRNQVTIQAMKLLEAEWKALEVDIAANRPLGDCHCQILLRYGIACKHYLKRIYERGQPIPRSLLHPRWWLQGPIIRFKEWRPQYPEEESIDYTASSASTEDIWVIRNQLRSEEQTRFDRQLKASHEQLAEIARRHLAMQELPIGNPDPVPKRKYVVQTKTHGRADARGLTGSELADRALAAKEKAEQASKKGKTRPTTPEDDDGVRLIPDTPPGAIPGLEGESQGGTTITLAIGSPRRPSSSFVPFIRGSPSPELVGDQPASTAPARQTTRAGRSRVKTAKAQKAREEGFLPESQPR
jgi:hypothetical protein